MNLGRKTEETANDNTYRAIFRKNKEAAYDFASKNTPYDANGRPVITKNDEWRDETEWDELFADLQNQQKTTDKGGIEEC